MPTLYNEIEPFAVEWLRNLIGAGEISQGIVDPRSIVDLTPDHLAGHDRCHFFAGIGGWDLALRLAGWPDDAPVWTGSCPCQPFSAAGKRGGFADERHLWPAWFRLIRECRPPTLFGEQVASPDGLAWLDAVSADLEGEGYAVGAVDLSAAGVGAPHIRQRLYWVAGRLADASRRGCDGRTETLGSASRPSAGFADCGEAGRLADDNGLAGDEGSSLGAGGDPGGGAGARAGSRGGGGAPDGLGSADASGFPRRTSESGDDGAELPAAERAGRATGPWHDAEWLACSDGKFRPAQPGAFPLAHGLPRSVGRAQSGIQRLASMAGVDGASLKRAKRNRTGRLAGYGNAIVVECAAVFVRAYLEAT